MARQCTICSHEKAEMITLDILRGMPLRIVAERYGLSTSAVHRHKGHVTTSLHKNKDMQELAEPGSIAKRIMELDNRADVIYRGAIAKGDASTALKALKELRELTGLYAKLAGELQSATVHRHLHVAPEWLALRQQMLTALSPYPEARASLIAALGGD